MVVVVVVVMVVQAERFKCIDRLDHHHHYNMNAAKMSPPNYCDSIRQHIASVLAGLAPLPSRSMMLSTHVDGE